MSLFDEVLNNKTGRYELKANEELFIKDEIEDYRIQPLIDKRLVKYIGSQLYCAKPEYQVLVYLLRNGLGESNAVEGWRLAQHFFGTPMATEKVRNYIQKLRNDFNVEYVIGSCAGGYYIARFEERFKAVDYIFKKSVSEMITTIRTCPPLKLAFIKLASWAYETADRSHDGQLSIDVEHVIGDIKEDMVKRYADREIDEQKIAWKEYIEQAIAERKLK
jgi:hypothetical protein